MAPSFLAASPSRIRCGRYNYGKATRLFILLTPLSAIKLLAVDLVDDRIIYDVFTDLSESRFISNDMFIIIQLPNGLP